MFSLSVSDDKPVVVVTHGDLLPLSERVRVRVYLGELLGVPPTRQIFDIPGMKILICFCFHNKICDNIIHIKNYVYLYACRE